MKAIVIEDEINVRSGFLKMLNAFCENVEVVGEAESVEQGLALIANTEFDLLFLDINLPDGSGFDLLHLLPERSFKVIFVTAYDQYALDAFKVSASDYLMKPIAPDDLKAAIRSVENESLRIRQQKSEVLSTRIKNNFAQSEKIILRDSENVQLVAIEEIIFCQAEGSYTIFHRLDNSKLVTTINLKEYERILSPYGFERCHHSYLVNLEHVTSVQKQMSTIKLSNDVEIPLSTRKKPEILSSIKNRFIG